MSGNDGLKTYLNDHLGGSAFGVNHAKNSAKRYAGTPLGEAFADVAPEIEEDVETLKRLMEALDIPRNGGKRLGARIGERLMRVKANGKWFGDSPLDPLIDLELMSLGIEGKASLWRSLAGAGVKAEGIDLAELEHRADSQRKRLEAHRTESAAPALKGDF
jgi:hypothetical protein